MEKIDAQIAANPDVAPWRGHGLTSTAGLSPAKRSQDLARRALSGKKKRWPLERLALQKWDRLVAALHHPTRNGGTCGG